MSGDTAGDYAQWLGRTQTHADEISLAQVAKLSAALDYSEPRAIHGQELPPCWHWLYFHEVAPASEISQDGHPRRGNFLPPIELPRRMWAGSRIRFHAPLRVGDSASRTSTIENVAVKRGRSGELVFVTVAHRIESGDELLIEEEQDLVYRESSAPALPSEDVSPGSLAWQRSVLPDPVLLFRYSALTFNSHRIHYDRDYAVHQEGYENLVVQGPLTATLLLDLLYRQAPDVSVKSFEFRGRNPLFAGEPMMLEAGREGEGFVLRASQARCGVAMEAKAAAS